MMLMLTLFISSVLSTTSVSITEPIDGATYDENWLPLRAIVENENEVPDSVHYILNGGVVTLLPRLNTDWPTYMQNYQNHGYSESPAPADNSILWTAYIKGFYHEFVTPIVVDGFVYYTEDSLGEGTNDSLYAFNAATGELIWKYDTGHADDAVTVVDGKLYSASDSLFCLDAFTGQRIWATGIANHSGSTPIVSQGRVFCAKSFVTPYDSGIYCLDAMSGEVIWGDTIVNGLASCMGLSDDILVVPTPNGGGTTFGKLYAIDAITGEVIWESTESEIGYWDSSPLIVDGVIYINDWYERTLAYDLYTGALIWEQATSGGSATLAYHDGYLYFAGEGDGPFYSLDAINGNTVWSVPGHQHGSSAIADGLVIYGEDSTPDDSARVIALDCETGAELWSYKTGSTWLAGSPSVVDGVVYIPAHDGNLYAFGTGLKYTYKEDEFYANEGTNELIVTSFDDGTAIAADTISFTVSYNGISLEPSRLLNLSITPNPVEYNASITFELSDPGTVSLKVFDLAGRSITCLVNEEMLQGEHSVQWNGCSDNGQIVSPGLYLCRIESGGVVEVTGLCLLK